MSIADVSSRKLAKARPEGGDVVPANKPDDPRGTDTTAGGSGLSLDVCIRVFGSRVLAYIRQILPADLRQLYDPVDLYQETTFEAFRRAPTFRHVDDASTLAWLFLLARRQVGMARRRERRLKRGGGRSAVHAGVDEELFEVLGSVVAYHRTPSQSAARHEAVLAVEAALATIPSHLASAVRLRYLVEAGPAEAAAALGRSERAVATLCYRGLRLLRRKMGSMSRYL